MKRVFAFTLAAFFLLSLIPATGISAQEDIVLTMSVWGSTADQDVYSQRLEMVHEMYPNITVELLYTPDDYSQRIQTMIAGGESPDIIQLAEDVHGYSQRGQLLGLNAYAEAAGIDLEERFGTLHNQYMWDGELYAMPDRGGTMILYYNVDMFDAAGIAYPTADWTWDDFLEAAAALTVSDEDGEIVQYGFAAGSWWPWWMSFIYQNGGRIIDEAGQPVVDSPEVIEALQFYTDLMYVYHVAPTPEDYANLGLSNGQPDPLFAQSGTAMELTGTWNFSSLRNVPDLNWNIAPVWQNAERGTVSFGSGLAISTDTEYPDEAFQVVEYLTSVEGQLPIIEESQDAPANREVLESAAFLESEMFQVEGLDINVTAFSESAEAIFAPPLVPEWNELQSIMGAYLDEVFLNTMSVEDAVESIQMELEMLLED